MKKLHLTKVAILAILMLNTLMTAETIFAEEVTEEIREKINIQPAATGVNKENNPNCQASADRDVNTSVETTANTETKPEREIADNCKKTDIQNPVNNTTEILNDRNIIKPLPQNTTTSTNNQIPYIQPKYINAKIEVSATHQDENDLSLVSYTANVITEGRVRTIRIYEGNEEIGSCTGVNTCSVRNNNHKDYNLNGAYANYYASAQGVDNSFFVTSTWNTLVQVKPHVLPDREAPKINVQRYYWNENDPRIAGVYVFADDINGVKSIEIITNGNSASKCSDTKYCSAGNHSFENEPSFTYSVIVEDIFGNRTATGTETFVISPEDNASPTLKSMGVYQYYNNENNSQRFYFNVIANDDYDISTIDIFKNGEHIKHCFDSRINTEGFCFHPIFLENENPFEYYAVIRDHYGKEIRTETKHYQPKFNEVRSLSVNQIKVQEPSTSKLTSLPKAINPPIRQKLSPDEQKLAEIAIIQEIFDTFYQKHNFYPTGYGKLGKEKLACIGEKGFLSKSECEKQGLEPLPNKSGNSYHYSSKKGRYYKLAFHLQNSKQSWKAGRNLINSNN